MRAASDVSGGSAPHEATLLSLSIEKAGALLGWYPAWDFREAVQQTIVWYRERHVNRSPKMLDFSLSQIDEYIKAAHAKNLDWSVE